jgi:shikimate dehydrogenase
VAFPVPTGRVQEALAGALALGIEGLSVTMPHKTAVADALGHCSPTARALQAVNTVVRDGDELIGESTDGQGFIDGLGSDPGFDPSGRRCLVAGAGGAGRAVVLALAEAGAAEVVVLNRTPERGEAAAALAGAVGRTGQPAEIEEMDLVVNATPVGMAREAGGQTTPPLLEPNLLGPGQVLVDLVYHPPTTALIEAARERGVTAVNGVEMLVHQAALAFRLWTGEDPPLAAMRAAVAGVLGP